MPLKMGRNDHCFCGSGLKYKKCHYPKIMHPDSRLARVLKLYKKLDEKIHKFQNDTTLNPPCQKGCHECCYHDFDISFIEFELILWEIENKWTDKQIEMVFNRALEAYQIIEEQDPEHIRILESDSNADSTVLKDWQNHIKNRSRNFAPCPLLIPEDGCCSIYAVRPFICRSFGFSHYNPVEKDVPLCSNILSSTQNEKITPTNNEYANSFNTLILFSDENNTPKEAIRLYPIFYWFKLYYDLFKEKKINYLYKKYIIDNSFEEGNKLRTEFRNSRPDLIKK